MKVLFATAELSPLVKVGGLGDAAAGLAAALRQAGVDLEVVLPDYQGRGTGGAEHETLRVPDWVGGAVTWKSEVGGTPVNLISAPQLARSHPYTDPDGEGWPDNDRRFMGFSAAVAALVERRAPDVLHINDWHTGATLGFLPGAPPTVFTMHNPAYQGTTSAAWLGVLPHRPEAYEWYGQANPLTGAIALADSVLTVSPTFASELLDPRTSFGLDGPLRARGGRFGGILNGIETHIWDPANDPHLPVGYDISTATRKREMARRLSAELGWDPHSDPIIGMVTRLTGQKGVDIALAMTGHLSSLRARMVLLGSGDRALADEASRLAAEMGDRFVFREGYDEGLAHRIFAGSDLYLVPSRFEPCGLTQMQAMRYGAIPVVTDVGGLHDTVVDATEDPGSGTGFVASSPTAESFGGALGRAVAAWRFLRRRGQIRRRGMGRDWSWTEPAGAYMELYERLSSAR